MKEKIKTKAFLFSKVEKRFLDITKEVLQNYELQGKVRIADFLEFPKDEIEKSRKIFGKHIDFLFCSKEYYNPVFGIELDDYTHNRENTKIRDEIIEMIYRESEFPLIRVGLQELSNQKILKEKLRIIIKEIEEKRNKKRRDIGIRVIK